MTYEQAIAAAEMFLRDRGIEFVTPGTLHTPFASADRAEIAFLVPDALNPNAVVDPPDVRVIVDKRTESVEPVLQM